VEIEVLLPGEHVVGARVLKDKAYAVPHLRRLLHYIETVHGGATLRRLLQGGKHRKRGGLARAVRPQEPEYLTLLYAKADPVDCGELVEPFGKVLRFYECHYYSLAT
jgi:hypothetical protein